MSKHTPGPWKTEGNKVVAGRSGGYLIARVGGDSPTSWVESDTANAHLISESPAMLETLHLVLNSDMAMREEDEGRRSSVLKAVRAVIARAEGRK